MTAIAGFINRTDGEVWIGGDSAGNQGHIVHVRRDPKVFRRRLDTVNGKLEFIFGFAASFRAMQLVRYSWQIPEPRIMLQDAHEYLATSFVDSMRECLREGGFARDIDREEVGTECLIGFRGRLFRMDTDYQIGESVVGYDAIGSGGQVCLGALALTRNHTKAGMRINDVLGAASFHCNGVEPPFNVEILKP